MIKTISVYCASSSKIDAVYLDAARNLGKLLANNNIQCVYGAGNTGLMGALANASLENGGFVTGIIPQFMCDEHWNHNNLSECIVTKTMHERKEKMAFLADAIVALPGGCGTLEELLEAITWKQLGIITVPIVIVNTNNYYAPLLAMLENAIAQNFMRSQHGEMWKVVNKAEDVLNAIANSPKWDKNIRKIAAI